MSVSVETKNCFLGPIAPVMTSFDAQGEVDFDRYREEVGFLLHSDISGISPGGSTGEGAALTDEELVKMIGIIKATGDSRPVVAGVIRTSTRFAVDTAKAARDAGADVLMVTPTFYNVLVPNEAGNLAFYEAVCEVGLPVVIYNVVPQNTITPAAAQQIMEIPNMLGVKQSVGGLPAMYEMQNAIGANSLVYAATDEMLPTCYLLGAQGAISAIVGLFPNMSAHLWNLVQTGQLEEALRIQKAMYPIWEIIRGGQFPARMKVAAKATGRDLGYSRSPLLDGDPELQLRIETVLGQVQAKVGPLT